MTDQKPDSEITRRKALQTAAATLTPATLAGCTGDENGQEDETTPEQTTPEETEPEETTPQEEGDVLEEPPTEVLDQEYAQNHLTMLDEEDELQLYVRSRYGHTVAGTFVEGNISLSDDEILADLKVSTEGEDFRSEFTEIELYSDGGEEVLARVDDGSVEYESLDCLKENSILGYAICNIVDGSNIRELGFPSQLLPFEGLNNLLEDTLHEYREDDSAELLSEYADMNSGEFVYTQEIMDLVEGDEGERLMDIGADDYNSHVVLDDEGIISGVEIQYRGGEYGSKYEHVSRLEKSEERDLEPDWIRAAEEAT